MLNRLISNFPLKFYRNFTEMFRKTPLIVILGSTGTGKTKLSIELADRFNGEILSADAMQLYKGLDIVTAKATVRERSIIPHHLLDIADPQKPFTVVDYRDAALPIIDRLMGESKIPVIVGGTNYYIESLLWKVLVDPVPVDCDQNQNLHLSISGESLENLDPLRLHGILSEIDPKSAERLHPNDKRKVLRAVEVFRKSGKTLSAHHDEQKQMSGSSYLGGPLRYEDVLIFWLTCDQEILNKRLDDRVDDMISQGLLTEVRQFYNEYVKQNDTDDYTKGFLQTIGFKELIPYLKSYDSDHDQQLYSFIISGKSTEIPVGYQQLNECLDELKLVTKRYSKKQIKWVANRFVHNKGRIVPAIYQLDTTNPTQWNDVVHAPAAAVIESYLNGSPSDVQPMESKSNPRTGLNEQCSRFCDVCDRLFIGEYQWMIHLKSNRHKRVLAKRKRNETRID